MADSTQTPPPIFDDDDDIFSAPTATGVGEVNVQPIEGTVVESKNEKTDFHDPLFADVQDEVDLTGGEKGVSVPSQLLLDSDDQGSSSPEMGAPNLDSQPKSGGESLGYSSVHEKRKEPEPVPVPAPRIDTGPAQLPSISPFPDAASGVTQKRTERKREENEYEDNSSALPDHNVEISITEYEKRGEGMSAFVTFKVVVKASGVPGFTKKEYVAWRRFSDFLGLHDKLAVKHVQSGRIVPPPPEKSVVGMTKTKMAKGNAEEDVTTNEFLEKRRAALERFLIRVSQHPVLVQDPDFRDFLTLETELPKSTQTSAISGAGVRRIITRVGDAISKMAYRMDETDRWFEEKQNEVEELDESLRKLHSSVEMLVHFRKELATSTDSFSKSMAMLAACEENTALSRAFSQLAETQEKVGLLQHDQAEKDFFILSEMLKDYIALIGTVKEVFYERVKVWQNWQSAQQSLTKKREVKTRLELAGKTDKLPAAKKDVQDSEQKVQELEEDFERISKMIRKEMRRFDAQRIRDFKQTMLQYLESLSLTQQQSVKYWEAYLPEAKAIIT